MLALAGAGCGEVTVVNRTAARADAVAALAGPAGRVGRSDDDGRGGEADLVVNATPVGMAGTRRSRARRLARGPSLLHGARWWSIWSSAAPTPWLAAAADAARPVDGLGMLVHQAAAQIELWTGLAGAGGPHVGGGERAAV